MTDLSAAAGPGDARSAVAGSGAEPAAIAFEGVGKTFGTKKAVTTALADIDLVIPAGLVFGVIGYSGAGKSTLVRLVNGLEKPTSGRVLVGGVDIGGLSSAGLRAAQKRTGMIFQQFNLLDTVTVLDNVALPLRLDGVGASEARTRARETLEFVGLGDRSESYPGELSGGQKQRVGIARSLVRRPAVLLADEATSALDPTTTTQIIDLLKRINREYGTTIVVDTHEMDVIKDLCDRVAVMEHGRVVEEGTTLDLFVHPSAPITKAFVGTVVANDLPPRVLDHLGPGELWRLRLLGDQVLQPLVQTLVSRFEVSVNMLHADMTEIGDQTAGQMIVKIDGAAERVEAARGWIVDQVASYEVVAR